MNDTLPYLFRMMARLGEGCGCLPAAWRAQMARAVQSMQRPDGGFPGRAGGSDLYYTAFAVRTLAILDALDPIVAADTLRFLKSFLERQIPLVDLISLLLAAFTIEAATGEDFLDEVDPAWPDRLEARLEACRCADGGYARTPQGHAGSVYQSFLHVLCYELVDRPVPDREALVAFFRGRAVPSGGFVEVRVARRPGVNPTAAAIAGLRMLDALDHDLILPTIEFVLGQAELGGGFRASPRAPVPDLLSTFTALWTLEELGARDRADGAAHRGFVDRLETPAGYLGVLFDEVADVEYTFYGVGSRALLALDGAGRSGKR